MLRTYQIEIARAGMELSEVAMEAIASEIAADLLKKYQDGDSEAFEGKIAKVEALREIWPLLAIILAEEVPVILWDMIGNNFTAVGKNSAIVAMIQARPKPTTR